VSRFTTSLNQAGADEWGPRRSKSTHQDAATARVSPYADAERKVGLIQPRGKVISTCGA